jgi:hypothetical protein
MWIEKRFKAAAIHSVAEAPQFDHNAAREHEKHCAISGCYNITSM